MSKQTVTIVGPNLIDQSRGTFEVHKQGCSSTYRNTNESPSYAGWDVEVESKLDVAEEVYSDHACDENEYESEGYWQHLANDVADFHFHNCVGSIPEGEPRQPEDHSEAAASFVAAPTV